jgi:ribosomal protein S2
MNIFGSNKLVTALNATAISGNGTTNGASIDTQGYEGVTFILGLSARTDGTYTPNIQDSDNGTDWADVSADMFTVTEATTAVAAANAPKMIGVVQTRRYARMQVVASAVTTGGTALGYALLESARHRPAA